MQQVIYNKGGNKVPIKMWIKDIEEGALKQAEDLSNLPFAFKHIAIMPDSHQGYGMPIGGVLATKNQIIPNAVGVDIGCGMLAFKTNITHLDIGILTDIYSEIKKVIPVGFNRHNKPQPSQYIPSITQGSILWDTVIGDELESATYQVGTLGGGNHFIEIQKDEEGYIWVMIHSGSRNLGFKSANYYHKVAKEMREKYFSPVPEDLAFLPLDSPEGQEYYEVMKYCVEFAENNRALMESKVIEVLKRYIPGLTILKRINKPHNFADREHHFGEDVLVHRKGACRAREGELGMIPGSQGTNSYIVIGKGNEDSFMSCSHGAGRVMSRTEARKTLDLKKQQELLNDMGVIHSIKGEKDLDEAPASYKDITEVMALQEDLVEIAEVLTPLAVIKG